MIVIQSFIPTSEWNWKAFLVKKHVLFSTWIAFVMILIYIFFFVSFIIRHRVVNIFLRSYHELWLQDENVGQEVMIEDLTVLELLFYLSTILSYWRPWHYELLIKFTRGSIFTKNILLSSRLLIEILAYTSIIFAQTYVILHFLKRVFFS